MKPKALPALGAAALLLLIAANNAGVLSYLLREPSALDARSAWILLSRGAGPALFAALLGLACWSIGDGLLRRLAPSAAAEPLRPCFAFALGLGAAASALFLLGSAGAYRPALFCLLLAPAALAGLLAALRRIRDLRPRSPGLRAWQWALALLLAYAGWHAAVTAAAPPTEWDVLAYHLALPKLYLGAGRIAEIPWLLHSHWPHLAEAFYGLPLAVAGDGAAALFHALCCGVLCFSVFRFGRKALDGDSAWVAAALLAAQPVLLRIAGAAHSDGVWSLFWFLSSAALWTRLTGGKPEWTVLAGFLAGCAAASKLLGAIPFAAAAVFLAARAASGRGGIRWKDAAAFAACGLAVALPWYLKAALGAGNPVWPFLPWLFGGAWGGPEIAADYSRSNFWAWPPDAALVWRYGPQFLLVPLAVATLAASGAKTRRPPVLVFLLFPLALYLPALIRHQEIWRFLLPFYPALCLTIGWLAVQAAKNGRRTAAAAVVAFGLWPVLTATQNNALFPVLGLRSRREPAEDPRELYLERSLDHYRFFRKASDALGPGDKVLLFREIRGYYLDRPYQWGDPLNQGLIPYLRMETSAELDARLRELGVNYVLVNEAEAMYLNAPDYYRPKVLRLMDEVLRDRFEPVLKEGGFGLYRSKLSRI